MARRKFVTEFQKGQLCSAVALGSDRATACAFAGLTTGQLRAAFKSDPALERQLLRAEAQAEVRHLGNIHKAAADEKNWRTSVWWLERHAPERFGRRAPNALTPAQVDALVERFVEALVVEVADEALRERLFDALEAAAAAVSNVPAEATQKDDPDIRLDDISGDSLNDIDDPIDEPGGES